MSTVKVKWTASREAVRKEYIETGNKPSPDRTFELDMTALTPEQRKPVVKYLDLRYKLDLSVVHEVKTDEFYAKTYNCLSSRTDAQTYDHQPTTDDVVAYCEAYLVTKADADAAKAEFDAQKQAEKERVAALAAQWGKEVDHWINNRNVPRLRNLAIPLECVKLRIKRNEAVREIAREIQETDKEYWIEEYGSEHLRQAFQGGYNCQRKYVLQRAAKEYPGFEVDFNSAADWKDRSCPSPEALKLAREVRGEVVWLTSMASSDTSDCDCYDDYYDLFEPCEAVVIIGYLDKYTLVKMV